MPLKTILSTSVASVLIICSAVISQPLEANTATITKVCSSAEQRQFDFWIGDWQVTDKDGKVLGGNHIFPILDGCALSENRTSARGNKGVSYNFYDKAKKQWHQTWIDASGGALYLNGGFSESKMVLQGQTPNKEGGYLLQKISWIALDDGRVKQHWQTSKDEGKTWQDAFVGYYKKN
jgi:hypothetical protein